MKVERVSYDIITPSAARGILEAIHWKPAMLWVIDRIHVLKPIRFQSFRRNEVSMKISSSIVGRAMRVGSTAGLGLAVDEHRQQRATTLLLDVGYVIEAHISLTSVASTDDTLAKHIAMFSRRAAGGQCFHRPYLGTREFAANFSLIPKHAELPPNELPPDQRDRDLGWMLYDISYGSTAGVTPRFFRAKTTNGVLDVQKCLADGVST